MGVSVACSGGVAQMGSVRKRAVSRAPGSNYEARFETRVSSVVSAFLLEVLMGGESLGRLYAALEAAPRACQRKPVAGWRRRELSGIITIGGESGHLVSGRGRSGTEARRHGATENPKKAFSLGLDP